MKLVLKSNDTKAVFKFECEEDLCDTFRYAIHKYLAKGYEITDVGKGKITLAFGEEIITIKAK